MAVKFFKDMAIGDKCIEKSMGSGARRGIESSMTYRKTDKSTIECIAVSGDFMPRLIGGKYSRSAFSRVVAIE